MDLDKNVLINMIIIPAIILYVLMLVVVAGVVIYGYNDVIQNDDMTNDYIKGKMNLHFELFIKVFDFCVIFLYLGMSLGMIIGAFFRQKTILMFSIGFIVWILSWFMLPYLANFGLAFMHASDVTNPVGSRLYFTNLLFNNYVTINVIIGALTVGAYYAKKNRDQIGSVSEGGGDVFA